MFENVRLMVEERTSKNGKPYMAVKAIFEDGSTMDIGYQEVANKLCAKLVLDEILKKFE